MADPSGRENRLAGESSPYLLLHAGNPVDWYPWGEEALARARALDRPIFLSVGYSTCYWCHVMERESFSDPAVAELLNREFVPVKVDREERPDLDEIYMTATQVLAQQGGWPNSVFLTPSLEPFFAGTYFPPADRHGLPGFPTVLRSLAEAWRERRGEVEEQAREVTAAMRRYLEGMAAPAAELPPADAVDAAGRSLESLRRRFDATFGGFGTAPKFPTPANLMLLVELAPESVEAGLMLGATLDQMGRGGICDQLAGGFHRYATDREWRVPHFEKMLSDNALLLEVYARDFARTGASERARVARATAGFLLAEMRSPEGAFWSALDAETDGHEGAYYVWTRAELEAELGAEDAAWAAPLLGFAGEPFFEEKAYVLHLPKPVDVLARERRTAPDALWAELAPLRARLLAARGRRRRPPTDDKLLADWNGLAIAGLATAGRLLGEPAYVESAAAAAGFLLASLRPDGGALRRSWRAGRTGVEAQLGDYAALLRGVVALHEATGEGRWLDEGARLADELTARLRAPGGGFFNAAAAPDLLVRAQDVFDGAAPAANPLAALALLDLAGPSGEARFAREAEAVVRAFAGQLARSPEGTCTLALAARRLALREQGAPGGPGGAIGQLEREARGVVAVRAETAGERAIRVRLAIAPGWHLQPNPAPEGMVPLALLGAPGALAEVRYPEPEVDADGVPRLEGEVEISAVLGDPPAPLRLRFQACDERRCLPPVEVPVPRPGG